MNLGVIHKERFKRALEKLQGSTSRPNPDSVGPITVITEKEQGAINRMKTRMEAVRAALKVNEQKRGSLQREQKEQEHQIDIVFDELQKILMEQRSALKSKLSEMINTQRDALQSQARQLMNHSESLTAVMKEQNAMITNSAAEKDRESKMEGITTTALKEIDGDELIRKWHSIELAIDPDAISKVSRCSLCKSLYFSYVALSSIPALCPLYSSKTT